MLFAFSTTLASAQFVGLTTLNAAADSTWNVTDKIGVGYIVNEKLMVAATMDGEDAYELLGRYDIHHGLWATCIYNYEKDSEAEIKYILLGIDTEFNQIYEVIETGKNETVTTISIVDFEFNLPLDSKLFIFDEEKYQDYYMNILD